MGAVLGLAKEWKDWVLVEGGSEGPVMFLLLAEDIWLLRSFVHDQCTKVIGLPKFSGLLAP